MSSADTLVAPAYQSAPEYDFTSGPAVCDLANTIGLELDPEQRMVLDAMFAERPDGKLAALESAIVAPRQNLKTHVFKAAAWADLLLFDQELVVWSAHEFDTAMAAFRDIENLIDASSYLSRRVKSIDHANGKEGIELMSGQRLRFKARTKSGARGLTSDRVFLDEAFALQPAHLGSLLPTMAAKSINGNPAIRYGSSAGLVPSAMLRNLRDRGRPGGDPALVYFEWCADERPCATPECDHRVGSVGCALDDRELWRAANLALGRRISEDFIATMRLSLPPEEFAREFLGWWDEPAGAGAGIDLDLWAKRADRDAILTEPVALAVDVAPFHKSASIVACGGALHVAKHDYGTAWVIPALSELTKAHDVSAVGLDPTGPAGALIVDLERAGFTIRSKQNPRGLIVMVDGREMSQACESFLAGVTQGGVVHRNEKALNDAVAGAVRRQSGDSWKWSRRDSDVDISPLVAATEAHHLAGAGSRKREFFGAWA